MIGQTISHYRVLKKIGEDGMGEVYLAEDASVERKVVLGCLPEYLHAADVTHKRFLRETKSAAAMDNPFFVSTFEFSKSFYLTK